MKTQSITLGADRWLSAGTEACAPRTHCVCPRKPPRTRLPGVRIRAEALSIFIHLAMEPTLRAPSVLAR